MWISLIVIFGILEAATEQLVTIWFIIGSVSGLIVCVLGGSAILQFIVVIFVSVVLLLLTRPLVKKFVHKDIIPTNADRVIGSKAIVRETVTRESGIVYVDGKEWSARVDSKEEIEVGDIVKISQN